MALLNKETGELTFTDGLRLRAGLAMDEVAERLRGRQSAIIRLDSGFEVLALCQSAERAQGEIGERVYLSWNPDEAPVVR